MGYLNILDFDFDKILDFLKAVGLKLIASPGRLLASLPDWVKYVLFGLILIATAAIAIWWWKNREEWRKYKRI